jgi:hypothetical protein
VRDIKINPPVPLQIDLIGNEIFLCRKIFFVDPMMNQATLGCGVQCFSPLTLPPHAQLVKEILVVPHISPCVPSFSL